ncbi:MAG: hypothetical protein Q9204_001003, partial [Flavoplaca sp. TL-2023a]
TNPYNGLKFADMPVPKASPAGVLMPRYQGWVNALKPIRFLQRAFRQYSNDFDIELCLIFPMIGDFKIKHRKDLTEVFVEHKSGRVDLTRDANGQISSMRHLPNYNLGKNTRFMFDWLAQWDFLLTAATNKETKKEEALFLIRDIIPDDWWNNTTQEWRYWPRESLDNIRKCVIDLDSPKQAVRQIETILYRIKEVHKTFKATGFIPVPAVKETDSYTEIDPAYIDDLNDPKGKKETFYDDDDRWTSLDLWKGLGSPETEIRMPTIEFFQSERLLELCREKSAKFGLPMGNGRVYLGSYSIIAIREREGSSNACEAFRLRYPIVPITFHQVQWIVGHGPRGLRDKPKPLPRSIVVLDSYSPYNLRVSHGRWVIPSDKLVLAGDSHYYKLTDDAQFEDYLTDEDDIVNSILDYLSSGEYVRSVGSIWQDGLARLATEDLSAEDESVKRST